MSRMRKLIKKHQKMACISYNKVWESEIDNIVLKKDKIQDINLNQLNWKYMILIKKMKKQQQNLNIKTMKLL